ncbi:hypothetical protein CSHISOI_02358 [Colletotrichum shisoi]|uniref:Filamentous hemagglutinin n=1 Tax=Colletotrichum shisoi TaxID=2078593 RepID=A0A5Q4C174_9PEZI|nr:hypothetical protein CSHISOI_02358 [Colletotrichum shisoi]
MAGFIVLLSAAVAIAVPDFIIARDVRATVKASTPPALPLAQVAVSDPGATTNLKPTSSSIPKPLVTLPVATLAYQSPKAAKTNSPNRTLESVAQLQPPKVIIETNYVVYTQIKTVAPPYITVTKTIQPPPPPPPPPPP